MAVSETCISAFAVRSLACTPGRKIIPGKEAYKLAQGCARELMGAVEVTDILSSSHKDQEGTGKESYYCDGLT